ncbi:hypothetical protein Z948_2421 [Sulfitobacter donghicola DSW-25 = KCTC 12864 = JCM 14565]|nr:hypothetical protein Z948_2421 [Sulfitobacter donghicola DSW-25 = KCTC 12864 = JCM 14565]
MGEDLRPAKEISEMILEITGKALLAGDFDSFAARFHLPHFISSIESNTVLETHDELLHVFKKVTQDYAIKGITNLVRICDVAEYRSPTRIEATHIAHMMAGDDRIGHAIPCFSVLEKIEGVWKVSSSQYAVDAKTTVGHALETMREPTQQQQ